MVQMKLFAGQEYRYRMQRTDMWTEGKGSMGRTNWECGTDTFTPPCVKQTASGKVLYSAGSSAGRSAMTKRGGVGVWWEGGSRGMGCMYMYS